MEYVKIGNIAKSIVSGGTPKSIKAEYYNGNIPWLNTKEINFNRIYSTEKCITAEGLNNSSAKYIKENCVIIAMYGATAGRAAINKISLTTNQACCNIEVDSSKMDYNYVYYAIKNDYEHLSSLANGGAQQNLNSLIIKDFEIPYVNLYIQKKISKILTSIDKKIELNNEINNNLYEEAVALYKDKFKGIGQGKKTIGDYIVPKRGKNLLTRDAIDGDTPVVAGGIDPSAYHNQFNTKSPVITISASGANAGYTNLWNIPVWASDCSYIDDSITKNVYFWYIVLKTRQNEIFDAQTGSAQPHIYPQHIAEMSIGELNIAEVEKYNNLVAPLFKMIGENQKENKKLSELRDTLLPKLMNGEIDLDNIEI